MARSLGIGGWDLLRPLDVLSSVWSSAAALPPVSSGAAVAYRTLFMTVKRLVVGRTLNVRLDSGEMTLTVTEFDSRLDVRRLAVGQLNDVRLAAADIRWDKRSSATQCWSCTTCTCGRECRRCWSPPPSR